MDEKNLSLSDELLEAISARDAKRLNKLVDELHPVDLALLIKELEEDDVIFVCRSLSDKTLAGILEEADDDVQEQIIDLLDNYRVIFLFNYMAKDDIVDILGEFPLNRRKEIINMMKSGERKVIQDLLGYGENTAGGIMTTEYIALKSNLSVADAIAAIKQIAPKTEVIDIIFIINDKRELVGTVDLRDILTYPNDESLINLTNSNVISVDPDMDQEEVSLLVSKYNLKAIPVVNKKNGLLGIITVDDVIEVMVEEHTEDLLRLGGASKEETIDSSVFDSVKMRLPWLMINLATAFLASFTVSIFEGTIAQVVALAVAMPIVAGMGGNAGTQTLSIVIRSIALGEADLKRSWKLVFKELGLGIVNGFATGVITGIVLYFMFGNVYLGFIIFAAMIANLIISGTFGFLIPLVLKKLKIDPALASSILLTTATDVFGFFVFLGLAQLFLPLLVTR